MALGPYQHGVGCMCSTCISKAAGGDMKKYFGSGRGESADSKYQPDIAMCVAKAMEHEKASSEHNDAIWAHRREGSSSKQALPAEKVAEHITASTFHNRAADHYHSAARAFNEERPKSAEEHLEFARKFGKKAAEASEKAHGR